MNRTGLLIALGLALAVGLLFGIYPELDLKLAALFYDTASKSFPLKHDALAAIVRDGAMIAGSASPHAMYIAPSRTIAASASCFRGKDLLAVS